MSSITITIPMDYYALTRASDMLHGMALDLDKQQPHSALKEQLKGSAQNAAPIDPPVMSSETAAQYEKEAAHAESFEGEHDYRAPEFIEPEQDAASVFGGQPGKPEVVETATAPETTTASASSAPAITENDEPTSPSASAPTSVDLDSDGLPWDSRIHSGSKGKLAKTGQWKKKRGVDPSVVEKVEAELHAAMAAGPADPVAPTAPPVEEAKPAPAPAPSAPTPPPATPAATGAITTFPALMQKITAAGVSQADITAAVNKQGLPALPLLAARPDLIPAVAAELFGG